MRALFRLIALVLAGVFVVTAVAALLVVNMVQVATNRNALKLSLGTFSTTVVESAPEMVVDLVRSQAEAQGVTLPPFDDTAVAVAVQAVVPPEWVEVQADTAIDAVFDALESGDVSAAQLTFDLGPILERMRGSEGITAVAALVSSLPECPEPADGPIDYLSGPVELPECIPPNVDPGSATAEIYTLLVQTLDANPQLIEQNDKLTVALFDQTQTAANRQAEAQFAQISERFRLAQQWAWLLWLVPAGCLLVMALFVVRSWRALGLWWGWPMVLAGGGALLIVFGVPAISTRLWETAVVLPVTPSMTQLAMSDIFDRLIRHLTALWQGRVLWEAGVVLVAGLLLVAVGYLSPKPSLYDDWATG
ncbi:MAG: hypothetical protein Kow0080_11960 [Candidatus Promineifilaceae bacterium]